MLELAPPIKAAWLGRVRSQSCEALYCKAGHNLPKLYAMFFLCSEHTVGNHGTQSHGTTGDDHQTAKVSPMSATPPEEVLLAVFYSSDERD